MGNKTTNLNNLQGDISPKMENDNIDSEFPPDMDIDLGIEERILEELLAVPSLLGEREITQQTVLSNDQQTQQLVPNISGFSDLHAVTEGAQQQNNDSDSMRRRVEDLLEIAQNTPLEFDIPNMGQDPMTVDSTRQFPPLSQGLQVQNKPSIDLVPAGYYAQSQVQNSNLLGSQFFSPLDREWPNITDDLDTAQDYTAGSIQNNNFLPIEPLQDNGLNQSYMMLDTTLLEAQQVSSIAARNQFPVQSHGVQAFIPPTTNSLPSQQEYSHISGLSGMIDLPNLDQDMPPLAYNLDIAPTLGGVQLQANEGAPSGAIYNAVPDLSGDYWPTLPVSREAGPIQLNTRGQAVLGSHTAAGSSASHANTLLLRDAFLYRLIMGPRTASESEKLNNKNANSGLSFGEVVNGFPTFKIETIENEWARVQGRSRSDFVFNNAIWESFAEAEKKEREAYNTNNPSVSQGKCVGRHWTNTELEKLNFLGSTTEDWRYVASQFINRSANSCQRQFRRKFPHVLHPGQKKKWTQEEDDKLRALIKKNNGVLAQVIGHMDGRSYDTIRRRAWFLQYEKESTRSRPWTAVEDNLLVDLVKTVGNDYHQVSTHFPLRDNTEVKKRWDYLRMRDNLPVAHRQEWKKEEDDLLVKLVHEHGANFEMISKYFPNRSKTALKPHWYIINRKLNRVPLIEPHKRWTDEENKLLNEKYNECNGDWEKIASHFPNRSSEAVKHHWHKKIKFMSNRN